MTQKSSIASFCVCIFTRGTKLVNTENTHLIPKSLIAIVFVSVSCTCRTKLLNTKNTHLIQSQYLVFVFVFLPVRRNLYEKYPFDTKILSVSCACQTKPVLEGHCSFKN